MIGVWKLQSYFESVAAELPTAFAIALIRNKSFVRQVFQDGISKKCKDEIGREKKAGGVAMTATSSLIF